MSFVYPSTGRVEKSLNNFLAFYNDDQDVPQFLFGIRPLISTILDMRKDKVLFRLFF